MRKYKQAIVSGLAFALCSHFALAVEKLNIIPKPYRVTSTDSHFAVSPSTSVTYIDSELKDIANYLANKLNGSMAKKAESVKGGEIALKNNPALVLDVPHHESESYQLDVSAKGVLIEGKTDEGIKNGVQTFLQMLPATIYKQPLSSSVQLQGVEIIDAPYYEWRGHMIDIARNFYDKAFIKQTLDTMAMHRLNVLHIHASDDDGYRLESKIYPKLHEIGSRGNRSFFHRNKIDFLGKKEKKGPLTPEDHWPEPQYLTMSDVKEIVAYAKVLGITVIPEIDLPGHAGSILRAYPEFALPVKNENEEHKNTITLNTEDDKAVEFMKNIVREVYDMFGRPGFMHIGADEVNIYGKVLSPEKQTIFLKKMEKFISEELKAEPMIWNAHNKPHANGGIDTGYIQIWHFGGGGKPEAYLNEQKDVKIINSWGGYFYLDMKQDYGPGLMWALDKDGDLRKPLTTQVIYEVASPYQPYIDRGVSLELLKKRVVGIEAPLWTETANNPKAAHKLMWPRLSVISEHAWRQPKTDQPWDSWDVYKPKLQDHILRLKAAGLTPTTVLENDVWIDRKKKQ